MIRLSRFHIAGLIVIGISLASFQGFAQSNPSCVLQCNSQLFKCEGNTGPNINQALYESCHSKRDTCVAICSGPPRVDIQRQDNEAIQQAQKEIERENRINAIVGGVVSALKYNPSDTSPLVDAALKGIRDKLGACSECQMERTADQEYLTKKIIEVAKRQDAERSARTSACVQSCPRGTRTLFEACYDTCQRVR